MGRYVATRLDRAMTFELEARDQYPFGDGMTEFLAAIDHFVPSIVDVDRDTTERRRLAAILFTDVAASTEHLRSVGDRQWTVTLDSHDEIVSHAVERRGGRVVKSTGDGALALFDGPASAVFTALDIETALARIGLTTAPVFISGRSRSEGRTSPVSQSTSQAGSPTWLCRARCS